MRGRQFFDNDTYRLLVYGLQLCIVTVFIVLASFLPQTGLYFLIVFSCFAFNVKGTYDFMNYMFVDKKNLGNAIFTPIVFVTSLHIFSIIYGYDNPTLPIFIIGWFFSLVGFLVAGLKNNKTIIEN